MKITFNVLDTVKTAKFYTALLTANPRATVATEYFMVIPSSAKF
jgi:hypothetical protein